MCLPNVTEHIEEGLRRREFLRWTVHEHHGTHLDAPIHFGKGKWAADEIPEASLVCPAVVIHVHERAKTNSDTQVSVDDLKAWEKKHGRIPRGATVFVGLPKVKGASGGPTRAIAVW